MQGRDSCRPYTVGRASSAERLIKRSLPHVRRGPCKSCSRLTPGAHHDRQSHRNTREPAGGADKLHRPAPQLQDVKSALSGARLVTLVGPGGVGKTRLALRSATDLSRGIADGAWLVELEGLRDAELVTKAVMTSLGLRDESSRWPVSRLIDYVASKRLLLVLDNCEHLIDACAVLSDAILREAPGLRILATSRQPLGVAGETVIQVGPLSVPEDEGQLAPERIAQWEAIALLVERAREAGAAFEVTRPTEPPSSSWHAAWTGSPWRSNSRLSASEPLASISSSSA